MSTVTCADREVIEGTIAHPETGAWTARLRLDTAEIPAGRLVIAAGDWSLSGTAVRAGVERDQVQVLIVAGAGRLGAIVAGAWRNGLLRDPLDAVLAQAGEQREGIATAITGLSLPSWTIARRPLALALADLAAAAGRLLGRPIGWRSRPSGAVWIGEDTWDAAELPEGADVLDTAQVRGLTVIGSERPFLAPGVDLAGVGRVRAVETEITADRIRTYAWS